MQTVVLAAGRRGMCVCARLSDLQDNEQDDPPAGGLLQ